MNTDIAYRYIGNGAHVVANVPVPARDILEWEVMIDPALKAAIEENITNAPGSCFERVEPAPVTPTKKVAKVAEAVTEKTEVTVG